MRRNARLLHRAACKLIQLQVDDGDWLQHHISRRVQPHRKGIVVVHDLKTVPLQAPLGQLQVTWNTHLDDTMSITGCMVVERGMVLRHAIQGLYQRSAYPCTRSHPFPSCNVALARSIRWICQSYLWVTLEEVLSKA